MKEPRYPSKNMDASMKEANVTPIEILRGEKIYQKSH